MRRRCGIAIDQAGHELVEDLLALELPDSDLRGRLKGDLQSLDDAAVRYCYYLRTLKEDVPPKWLVNFAEPVRRLSDVKLILVYDEVSPELETACTAAGLGVLVLESDDTFRVVVDFDSVLPAAVAEGVKKRVNKLRRDMEQKLNDGQAALEIRKQQVAELTRNMPAKTKQEYLEQIEQEFRAWDEWSVSMSKKLDELGINPQSDRIEEIAAEVDDGPSLAPAVE